MDSGTTFNMNNTILLLIPIHKRSCKKYYEDYNKHVDKEKAKIEMTFQLPFDELDEEYKSWRRSSWFPPPWLLNDIVGFLKISFDGGAYINGFIYLKLRYFPKIRKEKIIFKDSTYKDKECIYRLEELNKVLIRITDNTDIITAIGCIIKQASERLHQSKNSFSIYKYEYPLKYIDFSKIIVDAVKNHK